jgi:hypothetical protein
MPCTFCLRASQLNPQWPCQYYSGGDHMGIQGVVVCFVGRTKKQRSWFGPLDERSEIELQVAEGERQNEMLSAAWKALYIINWISDNYKSNWIYTLLFSRAGKLAPPSNVLFWCLYDGRGSRVSEEMSLTNNMKKEGLLHWPTAMPLKI